MPFSTIARLTVVASALFLGFATGCDRKDSNSRSDGDGAFSPVLWMGAGGGGGGPAPPPPPPPPPPTSTDVLTFEGYDAAWYAGNTDPLRTATTDPQITGPEDQLLTLINAHRVGMTLSTLTSDPAMREVARAHCKHMVVHAPPFFTSDSPELVPPAWDPATPPVTFWDRLAWNSVFFGLADETLAAGVGMTPGAALTDMLSNPTFQAIIEDPLWTDIGVGYWTGGPLGNYYCVLFRL